MPLITFTSDFGSTDHYTAAVKACIYRTDPTIDVIDICHTVEDFNIAHGAFVLKSVYREFPEGTVHLVAVDADTAGQRYIAARLNNHFFVSADHGLISLLDDQAPEQVVVLDVPEATTFAAQDILAPVAVALSQGTPLETVGSPTAETNRKLSRLLRATKKQINGHVIQVDHYGNLITNIDRDTFMTLSQDTPYQIIFGRERVARLHKSYHAVDFGECFLLFNRLGLLEIGINQGNAHELLGLGYDSPVIVRFEQES